MMANLSFLSALNEEQRQFAEIIRRRAREMGVPEDLAVAVAYQESRLNPSSKDSGAGAVGIMQVRPIAARDVGVNPERLRDPDTNIDAGLRYLKKALAETQDPALAVIYYNAGPQRLIEFDRGGDLPKETQNYLLALKGYGAFRPSEPQLNQPEPPSEPGLNRSEPSEPDPYQIPDMSAIEAEQERRMAQLIGGGAGAGLAGGRMLGRGAGAGVQALGRSFGQGMAQGTAPPTGGGMPTPMGGPQGGPQGGPAGPRPLLGAPTAAPPGAAGAAGPMGAPGAPSILTAAPAGGPVGGPAGPVGGPAGTAAQAVRVRQGTPGDAGTTGVQRMRFNEQTAQQAARTKAASGMFDELMRRGVVPANASQVLAGMPDLSATQSGILVPQSTMMEPQAPRPPQSPLERTAQAQEAQRRARMTQTLAGMGRPGSPPLPPAVTPPAPVQGTLPTPPAPKVGALEQVGQEFQQMARRGLAAAQPLASLAMRYIAPPLAGAEAGRQFTGMMQDIEAEEPDYVRAALRGLGGTASLASMVPPLAPFALPVAAGAPMVEEMRERMMAQPDVPDEPLTQAEIEMYSRPSFRMPAMRSSAQPRR
jgi:hypothetical protein